MSEKQNDWQQWAWPLDRQQFVKVGAIAILGLLVLSTPAIAHHPLDGRLPANCFEGILSGFGDPILGIDHLAFFCNYRLTQGWRERKQGETENKKIIF